MQVISVKKLTVIHVDKLSLCYLVHPAIDKHDSNYICHLCYINMILIIYVTLCYINMILIIYVTLCYNPSAEYPPFPLYFFTPSLPYS